MVEVPSFEVDIREAPFHHLTHGEILRGAEAGRAGEARTVNVGHLVQPPHQLRIFGLLRAQLRIDICQSGRLRLRR